MLSSIYGNHGVTLRTGFALSPKRNILPNAHFSGDAVLAAVFVFLSIHVHIYNSCIYIHDLRSCFFVYVAFEFMAIFMASL